MRCTRTPFFSLRPSLGAMTLYLGIQTVQFVLWLYRFCWYCLCVLLRLSILSYEYHWSDKGPVFCRSKVSNLVCSSCDSAVISVPVHKSHTAQLVPA
jgi:hypothetical protein